MSMNIQLLKAFSNFKWWERKQCDEIDSYKESLSFI